MRLDVDTLWNTFYNILYKILYHIDTYIYIYIYIFITVYHIMYILYVFLQVRWPDKVFSSTAAAETLLESSQTSASKIFTERMGVGWCRLWTFYTPWNRTEIPGNNRSWAPKKELNHLPIIQFSGANLLWVSGRVGVGVWIKVQSQRKFPKMTQLNDMYSTVNAWDFCFVSSDSWVCSCSNRRVSNIKM